MNWVLSMTYYWLKAGHIVFVIFWMAGLFMLPRFFVYHQEAASDAPENAQWVERESRLIKIILNPSMIAVWVLGLILAWSSGAYAQGWFQVKLVLVLALSGYHGWLIAYHKQLSGGVRRLEGKHLRLLNEVPGIATALIVIMVVIRPF